jgi:2-polyprenyl-6-methoxyphenol hydroxylase-like FAD-dependent oxidoreductase
MICCAAARVPETYCMQSTQVLVAGGGPVGLMLATVLGHFGIRTMLVERNVATTRHPKMDITNGRSMELFRKFRLVDALRSAAVPEDHPFDVSWVTTMTGHELHRFRYPSPIEARRIILEHNDGTQSREPAMRVSQVKIEPVLKRAAEACTSVEVRFGFALEDFREDADGVTVTLRNSRTGDTEEVHCDYLVGCDGGGSRVREVLQIALDGTFKVAQRYMVHFRSTAHHILQRWGIAWHYQSSFGTMIAQNDKDIWTIQARHLSDAALNSVVPSEIVTAFCGAPVDHEVLVANAWTPHLLLAQSYGGRRVFLAGDAAHQYIPTGGYGMNTGIGDAVDLGWKLAATLLGFGGPELLDSYGKERRPVGLRNREASAAHTKVRLAIAESYGEAAEDGLPLSDASRAVLSAKIAAHGNAENESTGIEFGYVYDRSPIVAAEAGAVPPSDPLRYVPTTMPGARLPSTFLRDGSALFDRLGRWFTLVNFGTADESSFVAAADRIGLPLRILSLREPALQRVYGRDALLVRPDQHIAWRGSETSAVDGAQVLARALGWKRAD